MNSGHSLKQILLISFWTSLKSMSPTQAVLPAWHDYLERGLPRRFWLAKLGLSAIGGAWVFVIVSLVIFQLSMMNVFIAISRQGMSATPDAWIFWTSSALWSTVAALGAISFLVGLVTGRHFIVSTLAWIIVFPAFLSPTGFIAIFFAERLGVRLRLLLWDRRKCQAREWVYSYALQVIAFVVTLLLSPAFYTLGREVFQSLNPFHPHFRFALALFSAFAGIMIQVILEMGFFHFYSQRAAKEFSKRNPTGQRAGSQIDRAD